MIHSKNLLGYVKPKKTSQTQTVTGFSVSTLSFGEQVELITNWALAKLSRIVCVANVHMLMEGHWNSEFAKVLQKADMLTPDGMPLVWITGLMNGQIQDRVAGMELMLALCKRAEETGTSIFWLGSTEKVLSQIRGRLRTNFPELKVAGMLSPPFRALTEAEDRAIATQINESGAGLVFVSLGCPKQELWMSEHRGMVKGVMVGLGGAFEVYAGEKQWAPTWMRKHGLEWFYRLKQDPRRLWKRYMSTIPPFVWLAFKQVVKVRLGLDPNLSLRQQWVRNS